VCFPECEEKHFIMKVLVANNYYYLRGGCERVMFNDMQALTDRGIEVIPFSAIDPNNVPSEHSGDFAQGVNIRATNPFRQLEAAGEAIHCRRTAKAFGAVLDKQQPDVVHCHNIYGRLTTSILPELKRRNIPAVLTVHDYKVVCPSYLMLRDGKPCTACLDGGYYRCATYRCHKNNAAASMVYAAEAYYARASDSYGAISAFLCPSQFIADLLVRSGIDSKRVIFHANSVDPELYKPHYDGEYVLSVGRLSHEKGLPTLVKAMMGTGIPLRVAGSGPMEQELRALVATDKESKIVFEGHCDGERLASLYRNAAFVVVPSEWYENAPMSILESYGYGKAVVASRIGGIPELVTDGVSGQLFQWGDQEQLQTAVCDLWKDKQAQRRMGRQARRLVETTYSQDHRTNSLLDIYSGLCGASGAGVSDFAHAVAVGRNN
jgi:glycosyltransferase involved in cell wall biosynthesis